MFEEEEKRADKEYLNWLNSKIDELLVERSLINDKFKNELKQKLISFDWIKNEKFSFCEEATYDQPAYMLLFSSKEECLKNISSPIVIFGENFRGITLEKEEDGTFIIKTTDAKLFLEFITKFNPCIENMPFNFEYKNKIYNEINSLYEKYVNYKKNAWN